MPKLTPMKAIKAKCIDCIYDPLHAGTQIAQIENCKSHDCPLHEHRPLTQKTRENVKAERIKNMTEAERKDYDRKVKKSIEILHKNKR